jgi:hypothetical protein
MRAGVLLSVVVVAVIVAVGAVASGAEHSASEGQADDLVRQALELRKKGENAGALELLQKAQTLAPSSRTLAQLASAEFALQHWVDAETHLQQALSSQDSAWIANPRNREMLERTLAETRRHVARLDLTGTAGAQVSIDGKPIGTLPLPEPARVGAGTIRIAATAPGHQAFDKLLAVRGGEQTSVAIDLPLLPPPAPAPAATAAPVLAQSRPETSGVPAWRRWTGGGLMVAGLAAIGTGIAWVAVDGRTNCAAPPGGVCELVYDTKTRGWISIATGAVAAGGGATLFFWKGKEAAGGVAVMPGGLAIHGAF